MSKYTITYTYDEFNRVIRKEQSDGAVVEFEYDDKGLLVKETVTGTFVEVIWPHPPAYRREGKVYQDSLGTFHFSERIIPLGKGGAQ